MEIVKKHIYKKIFLNISYFIEKLYNIFFFIEYYFVFLVIICKLLYKFL